MYKRTRLVRVRGTGGRLTFDGAGEAEVVSARGCLLSLFFFFICNFFNAFISLDEIFKLDGCIL